MIYNQFKKNVSNFASNKNIPVLNFYVYEKTYSHVCRERAA